jgi:hypothetical protein
MEGRIRRIFSIIRSEVGTVESALVLIPTVLLFLSVLQIAAAVLGRGIAINELQGEISREGLIGSSTLAPSSNSINPEMNRVSLPGGGTIIVGSKIFSITKFTHLILLQDKFVVRGIAIDEN